MTLVPAVERPLPGYAELHCLSHFSFQRGASHPQELVERAAALGYQALALTDECSVAGVVRAHEAARGLGLQLILAFLAFDINSVPKTPWHRRGRRAAAVIGEEK